MATVELDHVIRAMGMGDLSFVMRNERASYSHPWSEGIFADCLRSGYDCRVLVYGDAIVGHGILSVAAGEAHVLNVCVNPGQQGHGFGRILVEHLLGLARTARAGSVFLEVRPSNRVAYKLYESLGFNEIGLRRNYYPAANGREDALVLALELLY